MRYRFYTADVFTNQIFGGNPLAVFPEAEGLTAQQMQQIAREFNISETVFVLPAENLDHHRRVRIFTPGTELPFAGHPTLGTAHILTAIGDIPITADEMTVVLEEGVGPVAVTVRSASNYPVFATLTAAKLPELGPEPPTREALAAVLSLSPSDLLDGEFSPQAISCGVPFLFIVLRDRDALARIQIDRQQWQHTLASYWAPHVYVFAFDRQSSDIDLRARMFAPAMGVDEDPATGSAATALAGYLGDRQALTDGTLRWQVEQGVEMGRPSLMHVEADKHQGNITAIRVGGASVQVSEGTMEIPAAVL
jgi:trans-2,3-dihydro-3-hydroxyanthranilate isomerase